MPSAMFSPEQGVSTSLLASRIGEIEAVAPIDTVHWKSLKAQLARSRTTDVAGVAAKLRVVLNGIQFDVDVADIRILRSAIDDLVILSRGA